MENTHTLIYTLMYLDSPRVSRLIQGIHDLISNVFSVGQYLSHRLGSQDCPKSGGCQQLGALGKVLDITHSSQWVIDLVVNNGVNLNRDTVFGQDFLRGDVNGDGPQIHSLDRVHARNDEE